MKNILVILTLAHAAFAQSSQDMKLWYRFPADATVRDNGNAWSDDPEWVKALPLGNGSLGAMIYGGVSKERIQLNEKTVFSGSVDDSDNENAFAALEPARKLLFEGKYKEAEALISATQVCKGAGSHSGAGQNVPFGCYQTLGDLRMDFPGSPYKKYYRELNLSTAIQKISYEQDGVKYVREVFINAPYNILAMKISANKSGKVNFSCGLARPERFVSTTEKGQLVMNGSLKNGKDGDGTKYRVVVQVQITGGKQEMKDNKIAVSNADEAVVYIAAATSYVMKYPSFDGADPKAITRSLMQNALLKGYDFLKENHLEDYQRLFNKVSLQIAGKGKDTIPTDRRLQAIKNGEKPHDNFLTQLYFQYGRYLLISSSRKNTLPANLQGIWANKILTAWNGDYHTNINVQMNYWPAEATNLSECHEALLKFIKMLTEPGSKTARIQYHAPGWCVHTISNVWGFTSPGESPSWGLSIGTLGWMCTHIWQHYLFTKDEDFLKEYFPTLLGAAVFYEAWLTEDKNGKLVSGPASSPENAFKTSSGITASMSMGPSHDQEVIDELFENVIDAAAVLKREDDEDIQKIKRAKNNLLQPQIAPDGRLQEWAEPFEETEPGHRHISHLWGMYPGNRFTREKTPALLEACRKSLETRLAHGSGHTGWSAAWASNFWARLNNGDEALKAVNSILKDKSTVNLFNLHPPFQIDGNFGTTSGIAEMLVQSHQGFIELLPALPSQWAAGEVKGLCARGGFDISLSWENGRLKKARLLSKKGGAAEVRYQGKKVQLQTKEGKTYSLAL
ncbi:MAG: alpha-L-fucosidase [Candidatus Nephrothrix sp. EaCA]|nr:MAG: alpha-L-fucosidase [Candidatus Nephrothrix sp. EaCA]